MFTLNEKTRKKFVWFFLCLAILVVSFPLLVSAVESTTKPSEPSFSERFIAKPLAGVVLGITQYFLTKLLLLAIDLLLFVSGYNDFINAPPVVIGWEVVRDLANLFFIVVLLVIAFATILGQEQYHYRKLLPRFVAMAILINFSRTIAGVLIDFAQVVMLTFVTGFYSSAAGNFINMFHLKEMGQFSVDKLEMEGVNYWTLLASALLMAVFTVVALVVVLTFALMLLYRIVVLWILIILAPIAWLLSTIPAGQQYYGRWWQEFKQAVIIGPVIAFFLWLSLASFGSGKIYDTYLKGSVARDISQSGAQFQVNIGLTEFGTGSMVTSFLVAIIMLLLGLKFAQEIGGVLGAATPKLLEFTKKSLKFGAKTIDDLQAQATGIQFAKIPERVKAGLEARAQARQLAIEEQRAKIAQALGRLPGLGFVYEAVADPELFTKTFGVGGPKAILARMGGYILGHKNYQNLLDWGRNKFYGKKAEAIEKDQESKFQDLEKKRQEYMQADSKVQNLENQKNALLANANTLIAAKSALNNDIDNNKRDQDTYDKLVAAGIIDPKQRDYLAYTKLDKNDLDKLMAILNTQQKQTLNSLNDIIKNQLPNARKERNNKENEYKKAEKDYNSPANQQARKQASEYRKADAFLQQLAVAGSTLYKQMGRDSLVDTYYKYESEERKSLDPSKSDQELVGQLISAVSTHKKGLVSLLIKELANRGSLEMAFKEFGVSGSSPKALDEFMKKMVDQAGIAEYYGDVLKVRAANAMSAKGFASYTAAYNTNPLTGEITANDDDKKKEIASIVYGKMSVRELAQSIKSLTETLPDGTIKLAPQAAAILANLGMNITQFQDALKRGLVPQGFVDQLRRNIELIKNALGQTTDKDARRVLNDVVVTVENLPSGGPGINLKSLATSIKL